MLQGFCKILYLRYLQLQMLIWEPYTSQYYSNFHFITQSFLKVKGWYQCTCIKCRYLSSLRTMIYGKIHTTIRNLSDSHTLWIISPNKKGSWSVKPFLLQQWSVWAPGWEQEWQFVCGENSMYSTLLCPCGSCVQVPPPLHNSWRWAWRWHF